ncbi:MAG: amidase [Desulfobacterales bacterium]
MNELAFCSATELVASIKAGKITCTEMLDYFTDRIARLNPELNAVIQMDIKNARARSEKADSAIKNGEDWGPLHGLPVTIKDSLEVVGMPCSSGAPELKNHMPEKNADVVQSLIDAGAVVFGKTNMPLYGGDVQSYNKIYGQSNNPWDRSLTPGGSSGGAAAALAAGLTGLEIGSDIGGSIRTPAHFCGIYGHKPSFGIVPDRGHIPPPPGIFTGDYTLTADLVVVGPLARSADDLSLAMDLIVSPEKPEKKAWCIKLPESRKKKLKDFRIGIWLDDPTCPVDIRVSDRIQTIADKLATEGVRIDETHPQIDFSESNAMYLDLLAAIMGSGLPREMFESLVQAAPTLSEEDTGHMARHIRGATQLHRNWIGQDAMRQIMRQKWDDFFTEYDLLLCPVAPVTAFPHDHEYIYDRTIQVNHRKRPYLDLLGWAGLAGVVFLPATVAPAGLTPEGHPVGVQIVGPYLEDRTTIQFAKLMENIFGGFVPPPDYVNR